MPGQPTVSVVIPCYNAARFLRETLESVMRQTVAPLEVIVIDDGSADNSGSVAESFGPPVRVIRQANQGESVARNRGIDEAAGEWVAFIDADDLWHPTKLEAQLGHINEASMASVTNCSYFGAVTGDAPRWTVPPAVLRDLEYICDFNTYLPSSVIVRKDCPARFPTWTKDGEDYVYSLELTLAGEVAFLDEPLTLYRKHSAGQSASPDMPVRRDRTIRRWLELRAAVVGADRVARIRQRQLQALVNRAILAQQSRKWDQVDSLRQYLREFAGVPSVDAYFSRLVYPRWLYSAKDWLQRVFAPAPNQG